MTETESVLCGTQRKILPKQFTETGTEISGVNIMNQNGEGEQHEGCLRRSKKKRTLQRFKAD